jgi:ferredoxin
VTSASLNSWDVLIYNWWVCVFSATCIWKIAKQSGIPAATNSKANARPQQQVAKLTFKSVRRDGCTNHGMCMVLCKDTLVTSASSEITYMLSGDLDNNHKQQAHIIHEFTHHCKPDTCLACTSTNTTQQAWVLSVSFVVGIKTTQKTSRVLSRCSLKFASLLAFRCLILVSLLTCLPGLLWRAPHG